MTWQPINEHDHDEQILMDEEGRELGYILHAETCWESFPDRRRWESAREAREAVEKAIKENL